MKKRLIGLSLIALMSSAANAQKWSAGYRLGLVCEETFSNSSNKVANISNQVFVGYKALKWLELEVGLQHTRTHYSTGVTDEMFLTQPYYSLSNFRAQIFNFSLTAKYYLLNKGRFSVYVLTGASSCIAFGKYEMKGSTQTGDLLKSKHNMPTQFKPLATLFAGFGVNYQIYPRIKLNAQVAAYAANVELKMDNTYLGYLYNPDLSTQIGISYSL